MIFRQFPDLQWLKKHSDENFASRKAFNGSSLPTDGWPSVVLNVQSQGIYRDNILGPLSLFSNVNGSSIVHCDNKRTIVHAEYFYVTNQDQRYTLEIGEHQKTETLNLHFGKHWAQDAMTSVTLTPEKILDGVGHDQQVSFYNKLYHKDDELKALLANLKSSDSSLMEDQLMYAILVHLLNQDREMKKLEANLPVFKSATKTELIKRLSAAKDFIYENYHRDISLDDLAQAACLSKFHFLRLFKVTFNTTPLQFINDVKVRHAKILLQQSNVEVNDVARALGFSSSSSFSRMFFNNVGVYPSQIR
jgi:AraC family transcriptional regulator